MPRGAQNPSGYQVVYTGYSTAIKRLVLHVLLVLGLQAPGLLYCYTT